jgi:hypothetical protein
VHLVLLLTGCFGKRKRKPWATSVAINQTALLKMNAAFFLYFRGVMTPCVCGPAASDGPVVRFPDDT